jgi:hypothetical protein
MRYPFDHLTDKSRPIVWPDAARYPEPGNDFLD